jgi:hypothetical protein
MKLGGLSASRLRIILIVAMFIFLVAASVGFSFIQKSLNSYAATITKLNADAESGDQNILTLKHLQTRLDQEQDTIARARSVVADGGTYNDQVIKDLTRIASSSGTSITSLEFTDNLATSSTPSAGGAATTPTTPSTSTAVVPSGTVKKTVLVTIGSPLSYSSLMKFLQGVEINPLKMQLSNLSITKEKGDNVTIGPLSIEVYVRK